jgi:hypothetical protein
MKYSNLRRLEFSMEHIITRSSIEGKPHLYHFMYYCHKQCFTQDAIVFIDENVSVQCVF